MRVALLMVVLVGCGRDASKSKAPALDPVIGTRNEEDGPLTPVLEIDEQFSRYVGCDLTFANVPAGSEIELVWLWKPITITDAPTVIHRSFYRVLAGESAPKRAWVDRVLDPTTNKNALGAYECVWTLAARGASARLVVRAIST